MRADGHIDFFNRGWYEYTGSTLDELSGWGLKSVLHAEMQGPIVARWTQPFGAGRPFDMDLQLRRADGVFRWFLMRVRPLRNADATLSRWFGTSTDIEDVTNARAERDRLITELRQSLDARDEFC